MGPEWQGALSTILGTVAVFFGPGDKPTPK
jgi:hypothetical protein